MLNVLGAAGIECGGPGGFIPWSEGAVACLAPIHTHTPCLSQRPAAGQSVLGRQARGQRSLEGGEGTGVCLWPEQQCGSFLVPSLVLPQASLCATVHTHPRCSVHRHVPPDRKSQGSLLAADSPPWPGLLGVGGGCRNGLSSQYRPSRGWGTGHC